MRTDSIKSPEFLAGSRKPTRLDNLARRVMRKKLEQFQYGQVTIEENGKRTVYGNEHADFPVSATIQIHDHRFYSETAFGGTIGAGEAFIHGYWSCQELTALVRILLRNRHVLEGMERGTAWITAPFQKIFHWLNKNTQEGSRRNIAAHYDLGNEFYGLWLDQSMMYSSAYYLDDDTRLEEAAVEKLDRICRQLELNENDHLLEIGTGWGGFAIHAARNYGCKVTTTTISEQQYRYAQKAVQEAGVEDRVELLLKDYRALDGEYDKLVSIEMIEAVGHEFHDTFFKTCAGLLKRNGQMLLQAINIADQQYAGYVKSVDFIKRYIFPGGCLTSVTAMTDTLTRVTDMRLVNMEDIGVHYGTTLKDWRERFFARIDEVRALGFSDEFIRMWHYYLCYCEGAFIERATGVVQMHLIRPDARPGARPV